MDIGWGEDMMLLCEKDKPIGYIYWVIDRNHNFIEKIDFIIDPAYMKK
jgi:hypothetical protein